MADRTRTRINVSLDTELLAALDELARIDGRDRSHEIDSLVRAESERRVEAARAERGRRRRGRG